MSSITWIESDWRHETYSADGRFIAYGYADDDRMRYAVEDTVTRTEHDHMFPSMRDAQKHAERIAS